jgi:hypothetical protein
LAEALDATVTYNVTAGGDIIASGDSSAVCNSGDTISLEVIGANDYDWTWSPSTGLNVDTVFPLLPLLPKLLNIPLLVLAVFVVMQY